MKSSDSEIAEIVIDSARPRRFSLAELWRFRDLIRVLARRDIMVRYRQTALGALWAVLQPLLLMCIFSVIFGRLARMPSDGVPYPLFAFAGLIPWWFFANSISASGTSIVNSSNLVTKVYFPRLVIPVAAMGAPLLDLLVATALMLPLMMWYGYPLRPTLLLLPVLYACVGVTALGVGSMIAALTVKYRDFRHVLQFLTLSWLFITPIIYPPVLIPEPWRVLLYLNPMAGIVGAIRSSWFGLPLDLSALGMSLCTTGLLLVAGLAYFRATERRFADII